MTVSEAAARTPDIERRIDVRWQDLDPLGHVGHDVFLTFLEVARDALLEAHGVAHDCYLVAAVSVNYRREIRMGTPFVLGRCRVARVGRSSLETEETLVAPDGTLLADARIVVVLWDPAARRSRRVRDDERAAFERADSDLARVPSQEAETVRTP